MTRLLIVGPPGSGKGTQAAGISEAYGVPSISTGDIFRANIAGETDLGIKVRALVEAGDYVPDSLTNELVASRLAEPDARKGFLLDGYPRTLDQVAALDALLAADGEQLDAVIRLVADEEELIARLTRRGAQQGRADDSEQAIRHRQDVYTRETAPLVDVYRKRGLLLEVDGLGTVSEVADRIRIQLASHGIEPLRAPSAH